MAPKTNEEESFEAMFEMRRLRQTLKPLTALFLIMDYTQDELESAISKIDSKSMARLDIRFEVARRLLERQSRRLYDNDRNQIISSHVPPKLYTIKTAAIAIGISEASITNAINNGMLNYINVAVTGKRRSIRISQNDVDEFIKHKK